ncbi:NAD(P)/FAD-dependent oxidoreductase [Dongia rigui]|uniref:NAD(P)/FAD-dependent oxidoreductase n=1 Tax=Dongia rigui TaxID=940149 RepID=A0ABU5E063_9PROT|nr:NAD(P)/FAD-dependent oxidoreductase [Dongia rigui]MDY0872963.1 NAD(P)/FAD-dependent oxidoreductase [Dongia rigui]
MTDTNHAQVVVIGGGVVGCAIFRRFAMAGLRPVLLEAGADILSGASKANSALLHTGFDAPHGSLELACMQQGYREYLNIHERLNLPLVKSGAIVVAWNEEQLQKLDDIVAKAHDNNVTDVTRIDRDQLRRMEPLLSPKALAGVHVPGEHIIDPWSAPLAYVHQGLAHGGIVLRNCRVTGGSFNGTWHLETSEGEVTADLVINAAGNQGDIIEAINRPAPFKITPRKGQFVVFDKPAARLVKAIILPVPTERTKGVVICRTAFGNVLVGPTAEDQEDRVHASVDQEALRQLVARGIEMLPGLATVDVSAVYAGLRPATEFKDYQITAQPDRRWITVAGIRSTGLTGALGIAQHVAGLYAASFGLLTETEPIWTPVPNLCEELPRPYQSPLGADIVCHCEWVTRGEIENALSGDFPAGDVGGLKRRTRAMMGRCQGFYCSAHVMALADGKLAS